MKISQHIASNANSSASAGGLTTALNWPNGATKNNLLVATLHIATNTTVTCSTTGWVQAVTKQNGVSQQIEIWYKIATGSDPSPIWTIGANIGYNLHMAEIGGGYKFVLDKTGTGGNSASATLTTTASSTTTSANQLLYGGCGEWWNFSGVQTWSPTTTSGGATKQADIDTQGADGNANGFGLNTTWGLVAAPGSTPSMLATVNNAANATLAGVLTTFSYEPYSEPGNYGHYVTVGDGMSRSEVAN